MSMFNNLMSFIDGQKGNNFDQQIHPQNYGQPQQVAPQPQTPPVNHMGSNIGQMIQPTAPPQLQMPQVAPMQPMAPPQQPNMPDTRPQGGGGGSIFDKFMSLFA